jgi:hypothetical protein
MTKEQFKAFVENVISTIAETHDAETMVIEQIVEQWESDVNDARIVGQDEATSAIEAYMRGGSI